MSVYVYVVGDDNETVERVKSAVSGTGASCQTFGTGQWKEGMENPYFRSQVTQGTPSLVSGASPVEINNVVPFPGVHVSASGMDAKVSTMDELESKAIETAIHQFRGNLTEAAKALGIGRATLYRKVKQYHIDPSQARNRKKAA